MIIANVQKKYLLPIIIATLFGSVFVAGRFLADTISPLQMSFLRYCFATPIFIPFLFTRKTELKQLSGKLFGLIALAALLSTVLYHLLFYQALHFAPATDISLIHSINPLLTLLFSALILKEVITRKKITGFMVALLGVIIVVSGGSFTTLANFKINTGELLMLCATTTWALYSIVTKYVAPKISAPLYTALVFGLGWLMLLALLPFEWSHLSFTHLSLSTWAALAYMGVGSSGLGYYLLVQATRTLGPSATALSVYSCVPIVVAIEEIFLLHTQLSWVELIGFACIVCGMVIALRKKSAIVST